MCPNFVDEARRAGYTCKFANLSEVGQCVTLMLSTNRETTRAKNKSFSETPQCQIGLEVSITETFPSPFPTYHHEFPPLSAYLSRHPTFFSSLQNSTIATMGGAGQFFCHHQGKSTLRNPVRRRDKVGKEKRKPNDVPPKFFYQPKFSFICTENLLIIPPTPFFM